MEIKVMSNFSFDSRVKPNKASSLFLQCSSSSNTKALPYPRCCFSLLTARAMIFHPLSQYKRVYSSA